MKVGAEHMMTTIEKMVKLVVWVSKVVEAILPESHVLKFIKGAFK